MALLPNKCLNKGLAQNLYEWFYFVRIFKQILFASNKASFVYTFFFYTFKQMYWVIKYRQSVENEHLQPNVTVLLMCGVIDNHKKRGKEICIQVL
jgi:uncharacterized membrane protein